MGGGKDKKEDKKNEDFTDKVIDGVASYAKKKW